MVACGNNFWGQCNIPFLDAGLSCITVTTFVLSPTHVEACDDGTLEAYEEAPKRRKIWPEVSKTRAHARTTKRYCTNSEEAPEGVPERLRTQRRAPKAQCRDGRRQSVPPRLVPSTKRYEYVENSLRMLKACSKNFRRVFLCLFGLLLLSGGLAMVGDNRT